MATLQNSRRRLLQAVHAKVSTTRAQRPKRAAVKWGLVASLEPTRDELTQLARTVGTGPAASVLTAGQAALSISGELQGDENAMAALTDLPEESLLAFAEQLIALRQKRIEQGRATLARIEARWSAPSPAPGSAGPSPTLPAGAKLLGRLPGLPAGALAYEYDEAGDAAAPSRPAPTGGRPTIGAGTAGVSARVRLSEAVSRRRRVVVVYPGGAGTPAAPRQTFGTLSLEHTLAWARTQGIDAAELTALSRLADDMSLSTRSLASGQFQVAAMKHLDQMSKLVQAFKKQLTVEPIGLLHLERLTFTPAGIERGELAYSVPLAPGEEVNIAHKEWATRSDEFEKIVTDVMEEYSEEGVSEKTDLAQSTGSQQQHANSINTGVTASGGYGPVQISSSLGVNVSDSASKTQQFSRNSSQSMTRKASSRSKKEHKVSFKVTSASGEEDQSVRRFTNPFPDKATRVDYYQLIRKWQVAVWRYGVRLTYDLTIPEPGSDAMDKIAEINALNAALQEGFGADGATLAWARFDLKPQDVTPDNYLDRAAEYGVSVPPPPEPYKWTAVAATHQWKEAEEAERNQFFSLEVDIDADYAVDDVDISDNYTHYTDEPWDYAVQGTSDFIGRSGRCILIYRAKFLGSLYVELRVRAALRGEALQAWQLKAWAAIRDAAQARFYEQRVQLNDRLARLREELGAQDALSLRKFERDEIMKGVLRWLFGPSFRFHPSGVPADLYSAQETVVSKATWAQVLAHGELIRFLQQAIEWENVLYILYPYFWSHLSRWPSKEQLEHPDAMHRAFLKSGAARVVLTIRPGFERDFLSLVETGNFSGLPATHPYMTIVQEMEAYAHTNFPGVPPANEEGKLGDEEGLLVGSWYDYTPTSALDIAFGETMPSA